MEYITFDDALEKAGSNKHLILGNGFSVGLFPKIFNYSKLSEAVERYPCLKDVFHKFRTKDYEYVMRKILDAKDVLSMLEYKSAKGILDDLEKKYESLSYLLIETIANTHPDLPNKILEDNYDSSCIFLNNFNKIYTFNYDLILYWILLKHKDNDNNKCNDGFGYLTDSDKLTWQIGREQEQNLYYLHGALHLFQDRECLEKYTWINTRVPIKEQVQKSIKNGKLPLFIAEGSQYQKKNRIQKNGYLARTFSSLKGVSQYGGNIFVYGHSLRDEDDYVYEHMLDSYSKQTKKPLNIYVGYYNDIDKKHMCSKFNKWNDEKCKDKNIHFYLFDSEKVTVWKKAQAISSY